MKAVDFLIARRANCSKPQRFILGETGFSFGDSDRPTSITDIWTSSKGLPDAARDVLAKNPQFSDIVSLIGMPTESHKHRRPSSGWILARASSGLVSIAIRDAQDCDSGRLLEDAEFATKEAQRFAAKSVVILVRGATNKDAQIGRQALERTFGTDIRELNQLYLSRLASSPIWLASLSSTN